MKHFKIGDLVIVTCRVHRPVGTITRGDEEGELFKVEFASGELPSHCGWDEMTLAHGPDRILITIKDLDHWGACRRGYGDPYSDENLEKIFDGRPGLTVLEVLRLDISAQDRMWVALRKELIGDDLYDAFGRICAGRACLDYSIGYDVRWLGVYLAAVAARSATEAREGFMSDQIYQWVYTQAEEKEREWQVNKLIALIEEGQK